MKDYEQQFKSEVDKRLQTLENHVWGPKPGILGNQPLHYVGGVVPNGLYLGGYPFYFDNSSIFEVRAMVVGVGTTDLVAVCALLDEETQVTSLVEYITIPAGEHSVRLELATPKEVTNGDWGVVYIGSGGGCSNLTISWRVM